MNTKKRNRRIIGLLLAVILLAALLAACGDKYADSEYTGTWKCVAGKMKGVSISADKVTEEFNIILDEDGSAEAVIDGGSSQGEWEESGDGVTIKSGDDSLTFKKKNSKLVYRARGVSLIFKKSSSEQ